MAGINGIGGLGGFQLPRETTRVGRPDEVAETSGQGDRVDVRGSNDSQPAPQVWVRKAGQDAPQTERPRVALQPEVQEVEGMGFLAGPGFGPGFTLNGPGHIGPGGFTTVSGETVGGSAPKYLLAQ